MIEVKNLCKTFGMGTVSVPALKDVSLTIRQGEFVAIMGPSGSGKSTLLHILGFLDRPDSGSYRIFGSDVSQLSDNELARLRNRLVGFVFQQFHLLRRTSALENVGLPLIYSGKQGMRGKAEQELQSLGLGERAKHMPGELSGGEQQRVAIARALVNDPLIIFTDEPTGNLDTKSEQEILRILKDLNEQGKTIIMVTHEKDLARHAGRIIEMRDGEIVSEKKGEVKESSETPGVSIQDVLEEGGPDVAGVKLSQHIRQSFRAILTNKARSFLSMLGILIGVAAVIAMLALGAGAQMAMQDRIKSLGSNLLTVHGGSGKVRGVTRAEGNVARFTTNDVKAIGNLPLVKRSSGYANGSGQIVYKNENWNTRIEGVQYDYGEMRAAVPKVGRWFTREEILRRDKTVILGLTVVETLFKDTNPIGETVKINRINFKVIGIAPEKGAGGFRDRDDVVYMPLTTAMHRVLGKDYLDGLYAEIHDVETMDEAQARIIQLLAKRHRIHKDPEEYFHMHNLYPGYAEQHYPDHERAPRSDRRDLSSGGRHRHHEHHACVGHGAHP
jgi:macrolide transport system ATP-binding/permease protein